MIFKIDVIQTRLEYVGNEINYNLSLSYEIFHTCGKQKISNQAENKYSACSDDIAPLNYFP